MINDDDPEVNHDDPRVNHDPRETRVIRDPVHGYVVLPVELSGLLDDIFVQRLRGIKQTSMAYTTLPSMTGTRFEHSLGCMHLARLAWNYAWNTMSGKNRAAFMKDVNSTLTGLPGIDHQTERLLELNPTDAASEFPRIIGLAVAAAGLLHDIGHPPYSHALESFFERNAIADRDGTYIDEAGQRIDLRSDGNVYAFHEIAGRRLLDQLGSNARDSLPMSIVELILQSGPEHTWHNALHEIISSEVDMDRLDYVMRDASRAGTEFGAIDHQRIVQASEMKDVRTLGETGPIKWKFGYGYKARTAIETFLLQRIRYYQWVLYHPYVVGANKLLELALETLTDLGNHNRSDLNKFDKYIAQRFEGLRPRLNYIAGAGVMWRFAPDPSPALPDTSTELLRGAVDDSVIDVWLKRAASLARAVAKSDELGKPYHSDLVFFEALYEAVAFRKPNWAPVWKADDQYQNFTDRIEGKLTRVLLSIATDLDLRADQKALRDPNAKVEEISEALRAEELRDVLKNFESSSAQGVNRLMWYLLSRADPIDRLSAERKFAELLQARTNFTGSLARGRWIVTHSTFSALRDEESGFRLFQLGKVKPMKKESAVLSSLPDLAEKHPHFFVYYLVPDAEMRKERHSVYARDLDIMLQRIFIDVVESHIQSMP